MFFIIFILILWVIFVIWFKKKKGEGYRFSNAVLPLVLFSYLVTIDLGINFAMPNLQDGIGLNSKFAPFIIGEDRWSIELFKKMFLFSLTISIILTVAYAILTIYNRKRNN